MKLKRVLTYKIYLLQQENYNINRFWQSVLKKTTKLNNLDWRQPITWTNKLKLVTFISTSILLISFLLMMYYNVIFSIFFLPILWLLQIITLPLASITVLPIDKYQKNKIIKQAVTKLKKWKKQNDNNKIIAIAGSYGKTSIKDTITNFLGQKYNVLATEGNKNTPLGISRLIQKNLTDNTDVLVLELGEYTKGDIKELCEYFEPDMGVITGINEAHLERMGNIQNTIDCIFELAEFLPQNSLLAINQDDQNVYHNYQKYSKHLNIQKYSKHLENTEIIKNLAFKPEKLYYTGELYLPKKTIDFKLNFIAPYSIGLVLCGIIFAKEFELGDLHIKLAVESMKPSPHRLEPIQRNSITILDDSYNGNFDGAIEAINCLQLFPKKRKIYVTPGLVEIGQQSIEVHKRIGKYMSGKIDILALVKNTNTQAIVDGLNKNNKTNTQIYQYETTNQMHKEIQTIMQAGDVVVFQNDLTDNY